MYDQYIGSAHAEDAMMADLWKNIAIDAANTAEKKTTLLVTCDHGPGR